VEARVQSYMVRWLYARRGGPVRRVTATAAFRRSQIRAAAPHSEDDVPGDAVQLVQPVALQHDGRPGAGTSAPERAGEGVDGVRQRDRDGLADGVPLRVSSAPLKHRSSSASCVAGSQEDEAGRARLVRAYFWTRRMWATWFHGSSRTKLNWPHSHVSPLTSSYTLTRSFQSSPSAGMSSAVVPACAS